MLEISPKRSWKSGGKLATTQLALVKHRAEQCQRNFEVIVGQLVKETTEMAGARLDFDGGKIGRLQQRQRDVDVARYFGQECQPTLKLKRGFRQGICGDEDVVIGEFARAVFSRLNNRQQHPLRVMLYQNQSRARLPIRIGHRLQIDQIYVI